MSGLRPGKYVRLNGSASEIERWGKVAAKLDAEVCKDGNEFYLTSPAVASAATLDAARAAAAGIVERVNNAYLLANRSSLRVGVGAVGSVDATGVLTISLSFSDTVPLDDRVEIQIRGQDGQLIETVAPDIDNATEIVEAISYDDTVAQVVRYVSPPDAEYAALYKAIEIMQADPHGGPVKLGYITKERLDRLTANMNHQALSGAEARHARMPGSPSMAKKLTPGEVRNQVRQLALQWIKGKPIR